MSHDPHLGFIVAAYGLGLCVILAMIASILIDYLSLKRALSSFAQGKGHGPDANKAPALGDDV